MTELKLTPWFPPHIKPVHEGMYQVWHPDYGGGRYLWTEGAWHHGAVICNREFQTGACWRGLEK